MDTSGQNDENTLPFKHGSASINQDQSVREAFGELRGGPESLPGDDGRRTNQGLAPKQAIPDWLEFSLQTGYLRVTGQRTFGSDLEKIEIMEQEGQSLFAYARSKGLGFPERTLEIAQLSPTAKGGAEHRVFFDIRSREGRVVKVTFPGKYGRREHTPFHYLDRCRLLNEMVPELDIHFEDCIQTEAHEFSIVTSMQYFKGPHPSLQEADTFIKSLGFETLRDNSMTLDYINKESALILRDCHPGNWIKTNGALVPIDIIPEQIL